MRWLWRLWLRSGSLRPVLMMAFFVFFTLNILKHRKTPVHGSGDAGMPGSVMDLDDTGGVQQQPQEQMMWTRVLPPVTDDPTLKPHGDWMEVVGSERTVFVYSAYMDRRGSSNLVRVVAILKKKKKVTECQVWWGNATSRVRAKTRLIRENWNLPFSAAYILCSMSDATATPTRVSVVVGGQADATSSLPVQDLVSREQMGNMSVCVKPFHYNFDRAVWLVEFIEFYRLLGADKFIFYNHTTGSNVKAVLDYYQDFGIVTVLPWALPVVTQKEIRTEGIFAALNDCNLRSVNRFHLTAMVDVDEFLIPRNHHNLLDLVHSFGSHYDVYVFQNVFFYLYWENDTAVHDALFADENGLGYNLFGSESSMPYLLTSYKTRRLNKPHKYGQRSKYLVRPQRVAEVGNHNVWEHIGTKAVKNVPPDAGLSHHYRICELGGFDCLKQSNSVDRIAHHWLLPLAKRVAGACFRIFPKEGCPIAPPLGSPW